MRSRPSEVVSVTVITMRTEGKEVELFSIILKLVFAIIIYTNSQL